MKKLLSLLLVLALCIGLMAACTKQDTPVTDPQKLASDTNESAEDPSNNAEQTSEEQEKTKKFKIAICTGTVDNTWAAREVELLEQECTKETDRFEYTVNSAVDAADQQNILETYLLGDYDLIMVAPMDSVLMAEVCDRVYASGIPLFIFDRPIEGENFTTHIGGSDYNSGVIAGEYIGEQLGGEGDVVVLRNWLGTEGDLLRYAGFADTIKEKYPGINIVREVDGENSMEKGYAVMSDILAAVDHIDAVYAQVDEAGIGAEQAIRNAGRDDVKYIVGVGGAKECFNMMKADGAIFTAIATYLPTSGMYAVQYARDYLLNGGEIEKDISDEAFLITKDNVDEYYELGF